MTKTAPALLLTLLALALPARAAGPDVSCLLDGILSQPPLWPDYAPSGATLAPHCYGTNHQLVTGIQRVVFLGDSITVGTPPTVPDDVFRNRLTDDLVAAFDLDDPSFLWRLVDPVAGTSGTKESGDFASCARWGARAEDLLAGDEQLLDCFSASERLLRTLVVLTVGGNDVVNLAEDAAGGATQAQLIAERDAFVQEIEDAIAWLKTPGRFPNGVFVVLANIYDPTDGISVLPPICDVYGFDPLAPVADLMIEAEESLLDIATLYGIDLVFARERFCGRGMHAANPAAPCYRGAGAETFLDLTCIHPSPDGHEALADDFFATVTAQPPLPVPALPGPGLPAAAALLAGLSALRRLR